MYQFTLNQRHQIPDKKRKIIIIYKLKIKTETSLHLHPLHTSPNNGVLQKHINVSATCYIITIGYGNEINKDEKHTAVGNQHKNFT